MAITKKILKWFLLIVVLFLIQTITFHTLGVNRIKDKLLIDNFMKSGEVMDSAFVRDYYTSDCYVGERYTNEFYLNFKDDPERWKEAFGVPKIQFAPWMQSSWMDETPYKYPLFYEVYAGSRDWTSLYGFYECRVVEFLIQNQSNYRIHKTAYYRWCFFFWIEISHEIQ